MSAPGREVEGEVRVRRGRVGSVDLFEIKESELDALERGSTADLNFNFAIFMFSTSISALIAIGVTEKFKNPTTEVAIVFAAVVGAILGLYCLLMWLRSRSSVAEICKKIRSRIPPDPSPCVTRSPVPAAVQEESGDGGDPDDGAGSDAPAAPVER